MGNDALPQRESADSVIEDPALRLIDEFKPGQRSEAARKIKIALHSLGHLGGEELDDLCTPALLMHVLGFRKASLENNSDFGFLDYYTARILLNVYEASLTEGSTIVGIGDVIINTRIRLYSEYKYRDSTAKGRITQQMIERVRSFMSNLKIYLIHFREDMRDYQDYIPKMYEEVGDPDLMSPWFKSEFAPKLAEFLENLDSIDLPKVEEKMSELLKELREKIASPDSSMDFVALKNEIAALMEKNRQLFSQLREDIRSATSYVVKAKKLLTEVNQLFEEQLSFYRKRDKHSIPGFNGLLAANKEQIRFVMEDDGLRKLLDDLDRDFPEF